MGGGGHRVASGSSSIARMASLKEVVSTGGSSKELQNIQGRTQEEMEN